MTSWPEPVEAGQPTWQRLSRQQMTRLKIAGNRRIVSCLRRDQQPLLKATVLHVLLCTGPREHELLALDLRDNQGGGCATFGAKAHG